MDKTIIQNTFGEHKNLKRPEYSESDFKDINFRKVNKEESKDHNWFYIEFYGDDIEYAKLCKKLHSMGLMKFHVQHNHKINSDWFKKVVDDEYEIRK